MKRDTVIGFRDATRLTGAIDIRLPLSTDDALELAGELSEGELRHPSEVRATLEVISALRSGGEPEGFDAKVVYYKSLDECLVTFWNTFEGQDVAGVEIVRKR